MGKGTGDSEEVLIRKGGQIKIRECGATISFSLIQYGCSSVDESLKTIHEMEGVGRHYMNVTSRLREATEYDGQGKA